MKSQLFEVSTKNLAAPKLTFSGHESFQCRHLWLKKGYDFVKKKKSFSDEDAVVSAEPIFYSEFKMRMVIPSNFTGNVYFNPHSKAYW